MIFIQKSYLFWVVSIIGFLANESTGTNTTTKIISLNYKTRLIENFYKSDSPSFVFGACDPRPRTWQRSCTFAIQSKKSVESLDHVKICDFQIKAYANNSYIGQILEVQAFGDDKAILKFEGKYGFTRFAILDFPTCKAKVSQIEDDFRIENGLVLAMEDDIFDVVERKYGKSCGYFAYKKMIFDNEGKVITDLIDWLCNEKPHILAAMRSPLKGHFMVDSASMLQKNVRVVNVDQNGVTVLKEYSTQDLFTSAIAISNTERKFSICYQLEVLRFNCSQYDLNGDLLFETSIVFQQPTKSANLYNLPDGGILILAHESIRDDNITMIKSQPSNLVVIKINGQGKLVKIVELPEEFDHNVAFQKIHFHVDENREYCFSYVLNSSLKQEDKLVVLTVTCLNNNSLIN